MTNYILISNISIEDIKIQDSIFLFVPIGNYGSFFLLMFIVLLFCFGNIL